MSPHESPPRGAHTPPRGRGPTGVRGPGDSGSGGQLTSGPTAHPSPTPSCSGHQVWTDSAWDPLAEGPAAGHGTKVLTPGRTVSGLGPLRPLGVCTAGAEAELSRRRDFREQGRKTQVSRQHEAGPPAQMWGGGAAPSRRPACSRGSGALGRPIGISVYEVKACTPPPTPRAGAPTGGTAGHTPFV